MSSFTNTESYKHKCAKNIFKEWCDNMNPKESSSWKSFDTNYICGKRDLVISWRSNRSEDAWLEYPIVVNDKINSVDNNWDEIYPDMCEGDDKYYQGFIPTYKECIDNDLYPQAIVDVVLPHKGRPTYFIEICHTNPVSDEKIEKLKKIGVYNLIEIDAEWILKQINIPSKLNIKRWMV